jgi:hypothetical protein
MVWEGAVLVWVPAVGGIGSYGVRTPMVLEGAV